jgi:hypothetical protein
MGRGNVSYTLHEAVSGIKRGWGFTSTLRPQDLAEDH